MKANRIFNNGQKAISKVNFKSQFQKSKGRENLTTMLYSSSVKKSVFSNYKVSRKDRKGEKKIPAKRRDFKIILMYFKYSNLYLKKLSYYFLGYHYSVFRSNLNQKYLIN